MFKIAQLRALIQTAFLNQRAAEALRHPTSRRNSDDSTGMEAAGKYRLRKRFEAGRASSVHKLDRAARIEAGLRPLTFDLPTKRERKIAAKAKRRAA
jgi:hypothetical protein